MYTTASNRVLVGVIQVPAILTLTASFAACSGVGGDTSTTVPIATPPPPAPTTPSPIRLNKSSGAGIWHGAFLEDGRLAVNSAYCIVTESGQLACRMYGADDDNVTGEYPTWSVGDAASATLDLENVQITGSGRFYADEFTSQYYESPRTGELLITAGTLAETSCLGIVQPCLALYVTVQGKAVKLELTADSRGDLPADPSGVYSGFVISRPDLPSPERGALTIDAGGTVFLQTESGCTGNGRLDPVDSDLPIYSMSVDMSGCADADGFYSGLAAIGFSFQFVVFHDSVALTGWNPD